MVSYEKYLAITKRNPIYSGAALAVLLAITGGYFFYRNSVKKHEAAAYEVLADCMNEYEQAVAGAREWHDVSAMCEAGYQKYHKTKAAPYLLDIQVDALLAQDKKQEAYETLNRMVDQIGSRSPLHSLYKLKLGLLKIDMADAAIKTAGVQDLEELAQDTRNQYRDVAQYYLGTYYKEHGQQDKAVTVWKELIALNDTIADKQAGSPWATLAQEKMNGLA